LLCVGLPRLAVAQRLDVAGTVACEDANHSLGLAGDVWVVYGEDPDVRVATTKGSGTFRLIFYRPRQIRGKNMTLEFWPNQTKEEHTWFVPYFPTHVLDGYPTFVLPENVLLGTHCNEIAPSTAGRAEREENLRPVSFGAHFLQLLALLNVAAAAAPAEQIIEQHTEVLTIAHVSPGNESGPMHLARTVDFPVLGFRYAPRTYAAVSLATNPAAVAMGDGLEVQTNGAIRAIQPYRFALDVTWANGKKFGIGLGYYLQVNKTDRTVDYADNQQIQQSTSSHAHTFLLIPSYQIVPRLALAAGPMVTLQYYQQPSAVVRRTTTFGVRENDVVTPTRTTIEDELTTQLQKRARVDGMLSAIYDLNSHLRLGAGIQNLFGTSERVSGRSASERVFGAGFSTAYYRLQVGADLEYSQIRGVDGSTGASVFVSNGLELGIGYITEGGMYRAWTKLGDALFVGIARNQQENWFVNVGGRAVY
jgi:hypothetical protein